MALEGPPTSVVPVSMAAYASSPVGAFTDSPFTEISGRRSKLSPYIEGGIPKKEVVNALVIGKIQYEPWTGRST